ncbi:general stress protein [Plantactinospora alkalitolerans]
MMSRNPTAAWRSGTLGVPGVSGGNNLPAGPSGDQFRTPGSDGGTGPGNATVTVASYSDYPSAQSAVDFLSDNQFPVERAAIVGTDLALVETVLGRMTTARAALAGAATGAWFGLFIGLLFGIFTVGNWWAVILVGLAIGAVWGAIFGAIAHSMTGGRRDFTSASSLRASKYAVTVDATFADQARQLIGRMNWPGQQPAGAPG